MISLVGNELKKIFCKKAIYVLLVVTLVLMCVVNFLNSRSGNNNVSYLEDQASYFEAELRNPTSDDPSYRRSTEAWLEGYELMKKYGLESWQTYVIQDRVVNLISNMKLEQSGELYDEYKSEYDDVIARFDRDDWRSFVQEELDEVNTEIEADLAIDGSADDMVYDSKQVLEWRLEYGIPYGESAGNAYLSSWVTAKQNIRSFEDNKNASYQDKILNDGQVATAAIAEFAIKNGCDYPLGVEGSFFGFGSDAKTELLSAVNDYAFFIFIAVVIVAGTIVSEEFNKGTIKLLLVRPYSRTKILFAKFLASLIVLFASIVTVLVAQFVIGGVLYGFGDYASRCVVYDVAEKSLSEVSLFRYLCMVVVAKLPMFVLLMTLAFTISTVFTNSPLAIAVPLVGTMFESLINQVAYSYEKARFLMYFVTPNWDFSQYLYGFSSQMRGVTLPFSVCVCLAYFIVMMAISWFVFKKRDIKNV